MARLPIGREELTSMKCHAFFLKFTFALAQLFWSCRPATGVSRALRAWVSTGVSPRECRPGGVRGSVPQGVLSPRLRSVQKVFQECPQSVKKVSWTLRGHSGHFWDTPEPGFEGPWGGPVGHSLGHPRFWAHSRGHSLWHSSPKGPRDPCGLLAGSQHNWEFVRPVFLCSGSQVSKLETWFPF